MGSPAEPLVRGLPLVRWLITGVAARWLERGTRGVRGRAGAGSDAAVTLCSRRLGSVWCVRV
jgi:hypothetical protein